MRARFNHEGVLDHHADNEHDLFRRAEEALERQRQADHAARFTEPTGSVTALTPLRQGLGNPLATVGATSAAVAPRMPHEDLAERFAVKPANALPVTEAALAWPVRANATTAAHSNGMRSRH